MAAAGQPLIRARDPSEEKLTRVALWLKKIYGNVPIPKYEVNKRTVDILHEVMECNEERDRDVMLLIEDMNDQANKFEADAEYWQDILGESLGLTADSLSEEITTDITDMVRGAVELELDNTSLTSFYGAINYVTSELYETKSKNEEMEWKVKNLTKKLTAALAMEEQLEENIKKLEASQEADKAKAEAQSKNLKFLEKKSMDLKVKISNAENTLVTMGLDQSLTHEALMSLSEELAALHKEMEPLKRELASYHDLPLSIPLARVMVEEAKQELKAVDDELARELEIVPFELT